MIVKVGNDFEGSLRAFNRKVLASGLFRELKLRKAFESRGERRKRKQVASRKRALNKAKKMEAMK